MEPIDHGATGEQNTQKSPFVAPRSPAEERLATIWRELLKVERVGIYDNFYDLGGHSLLVPQLIWQIYEAFEVELSLRAIADALTIDELAQVILERQAEQEDSSKLNEMLEKLVQLSEDDVKNLLEKGG